MSQISPVNIVISEEPLLLQEACDQLLNLARQAGGSAKRNFLKLRTSLIGTMCLQIVAA